MIKCWFHIAWKHGCRWSLIHSSKLHDDWLDNKSAYPKKLPEYHPFLEEFVQKKGNKNVTGNNNNQNDSTTLSKNKNSTQIDMTAENLNKINTKLEETEMNAQYPILATIAELLKGLMKGLNIYGISMWWIFLLPYPLFLFNS